MIFSPNTDLFSFLDLSLCQHLDSAFFRVDNVPGVGGAAVVDQRVDREESARSEAGHVARVRAQHSQRVQDLLLGEVLHFAPVPDEQGDGLEDFPVLRLLDVVNVVNKRDGIIGGL